MDNTAAEDLAVALRSRNLKIVLAESCTGGLAAAMLTGVSGISANFCGSAVTYRIASKSAWLGIDKELIDAHTAESPETSVAMAVGILDRTPEADWSAAITGHLGPNAPPEKDGHIFVATARRIHEWHQGDSISNDRRETQWSQVTLSSKSRDARQSEAAKNLLMFLLQQVDSFSA